VVVCESLEYERQDVLGDVACSFDIVVAVWKYFRFHDRYQTVLRHTTSQHESAQTKDRLITWCEARV